MKRRVVVTGLGAVTPIGNNVKELIEAFDKARTIKDKPTVIIARTIKGKGISFMEDKAEWHGKAPSADEYKQAIEELEGKRNDDR